MPVHPSNRVQVQDFAVKLVATMRNGQSFHGTGFSVTHRGEDWLVTCRHNIELESRDFVGRNDLDYLEIVRHGTIHFDSARRVVGVRINNQIADCVAIELREGEFSREVTPGFDTSIKIWVEGENLPPKVTVHGPPPENNQVSLMPVGYVAFQGFAGSELHATTLKGAELRELPGVLHDWMIRFVPETTPGFSGGPVLRLTNESLSLLAITTHRYPGRFSVVMPDGRTGIIDVTAGAAVPIAPLFGAMESAIPGHSIADVTLQ